MTIRSNFLFNNIKLYYWLVIPLILDYDLYFVTAANVQKYIFDIAVIVGRLPIAERVGCGTPCLLGSMGVREVVGFVGEIRKALKLDFHK